MNAPTPVPAVIEQPSSKLTAPLMAGARPRAIVPADIDQVWRFATLVAKSGMAPRDMQKAETITVAIMHGLEVGLPPLMALQRIAVINGRPSIWGDGAMGLVRASGLCEFVYEAVTGEGDRMIGVCRVKRKGEKEQIERTFSVEDAKKAGLWGKQGPWQQYPKRMLQMRARAFALRDLFADVLGGLYIAEELEGLEDERQPKDVTPRPVVTGGRSELPPSIPTRETLPADPVASDPPQEQQAQAEQKPATTKKPLPPAAKARKPDADIPGFLRRAAPPADQPEAFREWVAARVADSKTTEDLQLAWDSHVIPNIENEQILPPDLEDLTTIFAERRTALEAM